MSIEKLETVYEESDEYSESVEYECIYFKYQFENCKNIDDILLNLENLRLLFEQYKKNGHNLLYPVNSGYCHIDKIL